MDRDVSTTYCWSSSGGGVNWVCDTIFSTIAVCDWWVLVLVGCGCGWRILIPIVLIRYWTFPLQSAAVPISCCAVWSYASGISILLSLLMSLGWSLMWMASLTLQVYQCGLQSINLTLSQSGWWPVALAHFETAEVQYVRALCHHHCLSDNIMMQTINKAVKVSVVMQKKFSPVISDARLFLRGAGQLSPSLILYRQCLVQTMSAWTFSCGKMNWYKFFRAFKKLAAYCNNKMSLWQSCLCCVTQCRLHLVNSKCYYAFKHSQCCVLLMLVKSIKSIIDEQSIAIAVNTGV